MADVIDVKVKTNLIATVAPTVNDDLNRGYSVFSPWVDVANDEVYFAASVLAGGAVWRQVSAMGGGLSNVIEDLTPQLGGPLDSNDQAINESEGSSVANAASMDIWATDGNTIHITGTTGPTTSLGTAPRVGAWRKCVFDSTPTWNDGANLILPGSANITFAADDIAFVYADTTTQFRVMVFRGDGTPVGVLFAGGANNQLLTDNGSGGLVSESGLVFDGTNMGIGTAPLGTLHVQTGASGATATGSADDLIIEGSTTAGINMLCPDNRSTNIVFGTPTDAIGAVMTWDFDSGSGLFSLGTARSGAQMFLQSGNGINTLRLEGTGLVGINSDPSAQLDVTAAASTVGLNIDLDATPADAFTITGSGSGVLFVVDGTGQVGVGTDSPTSPMHAFGTVNSASGGSGPVMLLESDSNQIDFSGFNNFGHFELVNSNQTANTYAYFGFSDNAGGGFGSALIATVFVDHANNYGDFYIATRGTDGLNIRMMVKSAGNVGVATITPDRKFHVEEDSAATAAVTEVLRITSTSTGTPANGIGVGLECEVETAAGNNEVGARIDTICVDVTSTSEDFAMSFLQMVAGSTSLVESLRLEGNKLGFYGVTTVVQPTALTSQDTSLTHTAPGTPDFAIQDLIDSGVGSAFGFATKDEGNTVLQVILNLQTRVAELETKLQALGLLA